MKRTLVVAMSTSMLGAPALASEKMAFEVLRPGDGEMSCAGLSAEIETLNADVLKLSQQAESKPRPAGPPRLSVRAYYPAWPAGCP